MAFAAAGTKSIVYEFQDYNNNTASLTLYAPPDAVTVDVATWATGAGLTLVSALTDAKITRISVNEDFVNDDVTAPVIGSQVERKGLFSFKSDEGGISSFRIPSFVMTKVIAGTNTINTQDTAVAAFIAAVIDTGLFDLVGLGNYLGRQLVSVATPPRQVHRGSLKG